MHFFNFYNVISNSQQSERYLNVRDAWAGQWLFTIQRKPWLAEGKLTSENLHLGWLSISISQRGSGTYLGRTVNPGQPWFTFQSGEAFSNGNHLQKLDTCKE